jgi:CRISPR/Cas system-associated exonuclease Cas4 (RecB family)
VLGISGKPDCLIRTIDGIVPVELKHSNRPPARGGVYPNHMIQNLAYCVLVEEQLKEIVPFGLVIYGGQQVRRVELTPANREWLTHTIAAVKAARLAKEAKRNHNQRGRCSGCGVRAHLRSGSSLIVFAFEIFTAFVRVIFTLALAVRSNSACFGQTHIPPGSAFD